MANVIEIWQPHYLTNSVYIAKYKVKKAKDGIIRLQFTRDANLLGKVFEVDCATVENYSIVTNGKIDCYDVPMRELREVG